MQVFSISSVKRFIKVFDGRISLKLKKKKKKGLILKHASFNQLKLLLRLINAGLTSWSSPPDCINMSWREVLKITSDSPKLLVSAACFLSLRQKRCEAEQTVWWLARSQEHPALPYSPHTVLGLCLLLEAARACHRARSRWRLGSRCLCSAWKCFARPHPSPPKRLACDLSCDEAI